MRQRQYLWVALACFGIGAWLITAMAGCAALGIGKDTEQDIRKAYAMAVVAYVDLAEVYADAYDQAPDAVKAKWKAEVTPRVLQASQALRIWADALDNPDARLAADKALGDLAVLLVEAGLLTIK